MNEKELAAAMQEWFDTQYEDARTDRNPVWVVLKKQLLKQGRWKDRPKGDPAAGYRTMIQNTATYYV